MYNTYNGWKLLGRQVIFGEKGLYRNEYGDYMYHISQTKQRVSKSVTVYSDCYGRPVRKEINYF